jgi:hypothetical protein
MAGGTTIKDPTTNKPSPPPRPQKLPPDQRLTKLQSLQQMQLFKGNVNGNVAPPPPKNPPPPLPTALDTPDKVETRLKAALVEQGKLVPALKKGVGEAKCASDFNAIKDHAERYKQANEFKTALESVPAVIGQFNVVTDAARSGLQQAKAQKPEDQALIDQWTEILNQAIQGRSKIRNSGLGFYAVPEAEDWPKALIAELKPFWDGTDAKDNEKLRKQARDAAPTRQAITEATKAASDLKAAIGKYQVRGMNRASTYFDAGANGVPLSPEDRKASDEALRKIAQLGTDILNNGGTFKQVKQLMAETGLTEEFWPPQLVQAVQAWRKTQRALQEERLRKVQKVTESGQPFTLDDVGNVLSSISDTVEGVKALKGDDDDDKTGLIKMLSTDPGSVKTVTEWLGGTAGGLEGGVSVLQLLLNIKEMVKTGQENTPAYEKAMKEFELAAEALTSALSSLKSVAEFAGDLAGGHIKDMISSFVPGIGIAVAGAELGLAIKDLAKASRTLHQTKGEKREAYAQYANDDVDEAMINAMTNAMGAEKTKVTKNSINCVTKGMKLGGSIASTAGGHYGAVVSAGLSVLATGIDGTTRVIFSGIDWGKAREAKKLLAEAQAGNMEAQVQIFEKSNLYAKMLLAISVKEGGALAKKYVVDRGIEEGDLDGPQSLEILRDAMLDHAEQKNDQEIEDNLLKHFAGKPGQLLVGAVEKVGEGVTNLKDRAKRGVTKDYKDIPEGDLTPFADKPIADWANIWKGNKKILIASGLIDEATHLTEALGKAAEADAAYVQESGLPAGRAMLMAAIEALNKVVALSIAARPVAFQAKGSPKRVPHKTAYTCLTRLRQAANLQLTEYWKAVDQLPGAVTDWQPAPIADLTESAWKNFWQAGQTAVGFPAQDCGVAEALKAAEAAKQVFETETDRKEARKLALAYSDTLDAANDAVLDTIALEAVNRQEKVRATLNAYMLTINAERQRIDNWIAGKDSDGTTTTWTHATFSDADPKTFASQWQAAFDYAAQGGYLATKGERGKGSSDGGLGDAVSGWQSRYAAYQDAVAKNEPKGRLQAARAMEIDSGKVKQALAKFQRQQRAAAEELVTFAQALAAAIDKARTEILKQEDGEAKAGKRDFDAEPKKKATMGYLSSEDWRGVHDRAVAAGAVLESGTGRKVLSNALKALKNAREAYDKAKKGGKLSPKKMRILAVAYVEAIEEVTEAVEVVSGLKRYNENAQMHAYLKAVEKDAKQLKTPDLEAAAEGTAVTGIGLVQKFTVSDWSNNKNKAVDKGVIPKEDTGMKEALGDYLKAKGGNDAKEKQRTELVLRPLLIDVGTLSKNTEWTSYIEWMRQQVV